jgi:2-phosphosulfolactate phosphatase
LENQLVVLAADDGRRLWTHASTPETAGLLGGASPAAEAEVAVAAFQHVVADLPRHLHECTSGRELIALDFADDVTMAAELDVSAVVPSFQQGAYRAWCPRPRRRGDH